ncbi:MAG: hypothetical protein L3J23_04995 [Flavobacteriaceae bacterium]|nr:hypothetical protein [Flavobacteriaceae bacterium]
MKKIIILIFFGYLFFCCKQKDNLTLNQSNISKQKDSTKEYSFSQKKDSTIFIPEFALIKPKYQSNFLKLDKKNIEKYQKIQLKIGNFSDFFLGNTDENDIIGHPDIDYDGFTLWHTTFKDRIEIAFFAKKILKYYGFFIEKDKLLLVTETTRRNNIKTTDSIFFENNHILLWKNSSNKFVTNPNIIKGKENYILRLIKEMKEIENNEIGYIEEYNYTKDSLSSFVIANLKKHK